MTSPILAADSASSYPATPTTFALPSINPAGGNVILYALVSVDSAGLVAITPDAAGWALKETNYADGTTTAIFRKSVPVYAGPYADTFHVALGASWGVVQFAFRSAGGADPANSNQDTDLFACVTNPTSGVSLPDMPTAGNLELGFVSIGGCGPPYTGSMTWAYGAGWTEIFDEEIVGIGCAYRVASGAPGEETFAATRDQNKISSQVTFVVEDSILEDPTDAVGWDIYSAADPNGPILTTLVHAYDRSFRDEEKGAGKGSFKINRYALEVTSGAIADGNIVKVRIPELGDDYIFAFELQDVAVTLAAAAEKGAEEAVFSGPGILAYLNRAEMLDRAFTTGLDISDTWTKIWQTGAVTNPVGVAVDPADSTYVWLIRKDTRRIYKLRQSDRKVVSVSPILFAGAASGLSLDPSDATIFWALEAPWLDGSSSHTKIHKIRRSDYANLATFDLGSAIQHTDIRAGGTYLWLSRYDGATTIYKRSKATGAVVNSYSISYGGHTQLKANGISVNGTDLAYWFQGTKRALLATEAAPTVITGKISTADISSFGGEWTTEGGQDYFYMVSYTADQTWRFQLTTATPHDPVDGIWRLDEGTAIAIAKRIIDEFQAGARPVQPIPDLTIDFTATTDSNGDPAEVIDGVLEYTAKIGDKGMPTILRLSAYGPIFRMSPRLVLSAYNDFGTDRSSAAFGAGKVRLERGISIASDVKRRVNARQLDSYMLAEGDGRIFEEATLDDLGYHREGYVSTRLTDTTALAGTAEAELVEERFRAESAALGVRWGDDEANGAYLPFVHYAPGDIARVHTGTDPWDYDEQDFAIYAIQVDETSSRRWTAIAELQSAFSRKTDPSSSSGSSGGSAGGTGSSSSGGGSGSGIVTLRDSSTGDSYKGATLESPDIAVAQVTPGVVDFTIRKPDLDELANVDAGAKVDGDVLEWSDELEAWVATPPTTADGSPQNEITPALQLAIGPWVGPSGAGQVTRDDVLGRVAIDTSASYKAFPGLAYLDGRLHLVYREASAHVSTGGVIRYRTSDDLGKTWSAATAIATAPAGAHDYRDPSIVALASGRLLVGIDTATGTGGIGQATGFYSMFSDDRGQTWSAFVLFPASDTDQGNGSAPAMQLADGRVLMPGYVDPASAGHYSSVFWLSNDEGETWDDYVVIAAYGARDYNETKLVQTADGVLRAFMRTDTGGSPHHTYLATASIADLATWSAPTSVSSMTGRPDVIEIYPKVLFHQGRFNTAGDSALHFTTSWDGGATWEAPDEVDVGETAFGMYSAPILLAPGILVVVYCLENSSGDSDVFVRWYHDGYGTDVSGNVLALIGGTVVDPTPPTTGQVLTATGVATAGWADSTAATTTYREVLMASGITDPPDPIISSDGTDWLYGEVS